VQNQKHCSINIPYKQTDIALKKAFRICWNVNGFWHKLIIKKHGIKKMSGTGHPELAKCICLTQGSYNIPKITIIPTWDEYLGKPFHKDITIIQSTKETWGLAT